MLLGSSGSTWLAIIVYGDSRRQRETAPSSASSMRVEIAAFYIRSYPGLVLKVLEACLGGRYYVALI
jgi:hypothetical protein